MKRQMMIVFTVLVSFLFVHACGGSDQQVPPPGEGSPSDGVTPPGDPVSQEGFNAALQVFVNAAQGMFKDISEQEPQTCEELQQLLDAYPVVKDCAFGGTTKRELDSFSCSPSENEGIGEVKVTIKATVQDCSDPEVKISNGNLTLKIASGNQSDVIHMQLSTDNIVVDGASYSFDNLLVTIDQSQDQDISTCSGGPIQANSNLSCKVVDCETCSIVQ